MKKRRILTRTASERVVWIATPEKSFIAVPVSILKKIEEAGASSLGKRVVRRGVMPQY